jgi:replicative DNA helicase
MIIIAARPSVGKTALALNFAWKAAVQHHTPVGIFSIEMPAEQLVKRLISAASCVSLKKITTGTIAGQDRMKVASAVKEVAEAPIYIDDTPGNKLMDIIAKARKLQAAVPDLGLLVVDYLGLVETGSKGKASNSGDSRQEEVRKISLALKGLARELNVPIIVISQLSRDVEKRESKKPMMSDLRDSGSIEQDADVIMLLYREDYYSDGEKKSYENKKGGRLTQNDKFEMVKDMKEKELGAAMPGSASYVEVNIAKNRNGQTGRVGLFFFKEYGKFDSPSEEWEEAMLKVSETPVD